MELWAYPSYLSDMTLISYIHVLSAAFLMGLAAAAPMGPVNMLAVRRGMLGGWRHTLACGIGSVTGDLVLFSLVLLGGHYLFSDLSNPTLQTFMTVIGLIVLLPLAIYFLVRAVKDPLRAYASARQHWDEETIPAHLVAELAECRPHHLQSLNHCLLGWRHLQLAPFCSFSFGPQCRGVGNPDGRRRPDGLVYRADRRRSLSPPLDRPDLLPNRECHPGPYPPWLCHFLCDTAIPPFPALTRSVLNVRVSQRAHHLCTPVKRICEGFSKGKSPIVLEGVYSAASPCWSGGIDRPLISRRNKLDKLSEER